jgi:hypothetical protein
LTAGEGQSGLLGREAETARLGELLAAHGAAVVHGPAGIGKTSLVLFACAAAVEAQAIPEVVCVSLAGVTDAREAVERSARAVGATRPAPAPGRVPDALAMLLEEHPRTLVWDDLEDGARELAQCAQRILETGARGRGAARLVLVGRKHPAPRDAGLRAVSFEVGPLGHQAAVELVRRVERERGATLADDLAAAAAGNPLLIRIALAERTTPAVGPDAAAALRRSLAAHARGPAQKVLALLAAGAVPLDEEDVASAVGRGARASIEVLATHLLVQRSGSRLVVAPPVFPLVDEALGLPDAATWRALGKIAERSLAAAPHDDAALVLACRARLARGDAKGALALAQAHPLARASAPTSALDRVLRAVAAGSSTHAGAALRLLAREHLRVGDYESARRTLDEAPRPRVRADAERLALLRAECHMRAGEPDAARRAIDALGPPKARENPGVALTRAQLAILRGELALAREALERLSPKTRDVPHLEARRAAQLAGSWLYEEQYDRTHAEVARARAAQKAAGLRVDPVVTILDVHALLGLGDAHRAEEVLAREARGRPDALPLEVALHVRRGDFASALALGEDALAVLDRRSDLLFRSVLARDLARACIGTGQLARAGKLLRLAESGADEPGLRALRPICDAELARLHEAEGDLVRARRRIDRAHARLLDSPFMTIDREILHGRTPEPRADAPDVVHAYAKLRSAEAALERGALREALALADAAERFYAEARLEHEVARAGLVRAEALTRLVRAGDRGDLEAAARAEQAALSCEALAERRGYVPIVVACALVRAALFEHHGELRESARILVSALRSAGETLDAPLALAAARTGVAVRVPRGEARGHGAYAARVERLGLLAEGNVVWSVGARTWLRPEGAPPPERVACTVDVDRRRVIADDGRVVSLPEQRIALLRALAEAGEGGATLEELFGRVWSGTFHPLRHRNSVYVALTRLKDSMKPFARDVRITHDGERYRAEGELPIAVRRRKRRDSPPIVALDVSGESGP